MEVLMHPSTAFAAALTIADIITIIPANPTKLA
jgi:hypothetical protein